MSDDCRRRPVTGLRNARERHQNAFGSPACFKIAFASGRFLMFIGTGKVRPVIGLHQIS